MKNKLKNQPYKIIPQYLEKVWGRNLENHDNKKIGEIVLCDNNSYLDDIETPIKSLISTNLNFFSINNDKPFIVLKFITTNDNLSIQVHNSQNSIKQDESWIVSKSSFFSKFLLGSKNNLTDSCNISNKTYKKMFDFTKVKQNHHIFVPAGLVHSIDKNIELFEIKTSNSETYRLYDFGRNRSINKDKFFENYNNLKQPTINKLSKNYKFKSNNYKFLYNHLHFQSVAINPTESYHILAIMSGKGKIVSKKFLKVIKEFDTFLIPSNYKYSLEGNLKYLLISPC